MQHTYTASLYLIPVPITSNANSYVLPLDTQCVVQRIGHFLVEDIRTARRYISQVGHVMPLSQIDFVQLDKHNPYQDIATAMQPLREGKDMGVLSEAGCPGIADPGSEVVTYAHKNNINVIPLVGPCSLLLALMASGFNGQNFAFNGYLPIEQQARRVAIKKIEHKALQAGQTQIFIETPYRNQRLLEALLEICDAHTRLCIGKHLTAPDSWVRSRSIQEWKNQKPDLDKIPTVFLLAR